MRIRPERLTGGYDVDANAARFSNYFHVLRELVHLSCGWLALEPAWERKLALGEQIHDDARGIAKVKRRLYELRHPSDYPGAPGAELAELLDELAAAGSPADYERLAFGTVKPTLAAALRHHLEDLDPVLDEPSEKLLRKLLVRQEHHVQALATTAPRVAAADLGALDLRLRGEPRTLRILPPLDEPARDPFVEVTPDGDPFLSADLYVNGAENHVPTDADEQRHFFHGLMDAELCAAELMARNSHEHPDMPWDFHCDMARQTWDEVRHARAHDVLMRQELGCRWGDYPVGFAYFRSIYSYDLLGRLALFNGTSEQRAMWRHSHRRKVLESRGQHVVASVFDYLLADEVPHVHNGARWGAWLLGGDERAYREKVRELRQGLDRTGAPAG